MQGSAGGKPALPHDPVAQRFGDGLGFGVDLQLSTTDERQQAHALLDMLPASTLHTVRNLLELLVEPVAHSLTATQVEDEEITPEAAQLLERSRASLASGNGIAHEEIVREFGFDE